MSGRGDSLLLQKNDMDDGLVDLQATYFISTIVRVWTTLPDTSRTK